VKELPISKKWTFDGHEQLFEIDSVIADPAAVDYEPYAALVGKMTGGNLHRSVAGTGRRLARMDPADIGGVIRGDLQGQKLMVPPQKTLIVRIGMQ
jgi:hypothetical protein